MSKRILILGGTGAMGTYLVPELLKNDYKVDVTSRSGGRNGLRLKYLYGDAKNIKFLQKILRDNKYDVIIDFMTYSTSEFKGRIDALLDNTSQYIFISTYRVFSDKDKLITEKTPHLLDIVKDQEYLKTDEYALAKSRCETILRNSKHKNWTIVRPSITYSKQRFQLGVLEAEIFLRRALNGKTIAFPKDMLNKKTTMTWAGDVAKMITGLVLNKKALGEDFNVVTSESVSWKSVIDVYKKHIPLEVKYVSLEDFINIYPNKYQIIYDRMFNRSMDNSKILNTTGLSNNDFISLEKGLEAELNIFIKDPVFNNGNSLYDDMDLLTDNKFVKTIRKTKPRTNYNKIKNKIRLRTRIKELKRRARVRSRIRSALSVVHNRSVDGAIITLTGAHNYGNLLQRYALKKVLSDRGLKFDSLILPHYTQDAEQENYREMQKFIKDYIGSKKFDTEFSRRYKNYIVGSDQVWRNWQNDWGDFSTYFLEFNKDDKNTNRLSYAASFGTDNLKDANIDKKTEDIIRPLLKRFSGISVREDSGKDILLKLLDSKDTSKVEVVLDPVLLLQAKDYNEIIKNQDRDNIGLFSYILDLNSDKEEFIKNFKIKSNSSKEIINPTENNYYVSVEKWLKGFRDAGFIVTDSFHGAVLAILNHKDFIIIKNEARGGTRFDNLLRITAISEDRLVTEKELNNIDIKSLKIINWGEVDRSLNEHRKRSLGWLLKNIKR